MAEVKQDHSNADANLNGANTMCLKGFRFFPYSAGSSNFCALRVFSAYSTLNFIFNSF
jgi:hypothetical protein